MIGTFEGTSVALPGNHGSLMETDEDVRNFSQA